MKRGDLRIYVGYAAGVGKTFAMLGEGHRRRDRGTDVVIGLVETHGRPVTQQALGDLEVVPRRSVEYRGADFEEMDVDAIVARAPEIALIDELAHTNVPGSRHEKRWQDVDEVLEAGIDVISTVNIQHLESLNDVVERITGVAQRETIPDEIVRAADQQELVDMTPYALRRRMAHGNIYPPEKVDAALGNYFREGNLGALRELALLWMADRVDESLQDYMKVRGIEGPWEARERILVGVSGRKDDEMLIRRAARMATRRGGDLVAVNVIPEDALAEPGAIEGTRELVRTLGGTFREVVGRGIPEALLDVARAENVTQIVIGASSHSRWREFFRGSVVHRIIRDSGPIDVHVISQDTPSSGDSLAAPPPPGLTWNRRMAGWVVGAAGLVLLTLVLTAARERLSLPSVMLLYLSLVVAVAAVGGLWPAVVSALASGLLINWYFTEPIHTWTIAEAENVLAVCVFVFVASVVSVLVDRAARARVEARRGRAEAEALARLAGWLASEDDPLPTLLGQLRDTFALEAVSVLRPEEETWVVESSSGPTPPAQPTDGSDLIELSDGAVLVLRGDRMPAESRRVLAAFAAHMSVAVRARDLSEEVAEAAELTEGDELRTAILQAVSHDLRTPLASIKASVSSLRQDDVVWSVDEREEFEATIEEETDRLTNMVGNLLDMSRIQSGSLHLVRGNVGLDEVVPRALASLPDGGRSIVVEVPETLPRVDVDAALLERAIANVAGNACSWTPEREHVAIVGSYAAGRVELRVIDRGPGIAPVDRERVFEPFQRLGDRSPADGVGLGLAVAKGFIEAMGGKVAIEDTPGGGLTMILTFEEAA
jgi:two-component system, OmpR family, sensor histidine kinase KdpD